MVRVCGEMLPRLTVHLLAVAEMAIQHVLHRHGGKHRIQTGGPRRQALRQGGKRVGETHRYRSVRAAPPEGIAAILRTREALHFLKHPAAANGTVELARCLAN